MLDSDNSNARVWARVTGLLVLAFAAVGTLAQLAFTWIEATYKYDLRLGRDLAREVGDLLGPMISAEWTLGLLALALGLLMLARAGGSSRVAALVGGLAGLLGAIASARLMTTSFDTPPLELWRHLAFGGHLLARLGAIAAVVVLARGHARARIHRILAGIAGITPLVLVVTLVAIEVIYTLNDGLIPWGAVLMIVGDVALGLALLGVSDELDEPTLDRASARTLELARTLLWTRVGVVTVSVIASTKAMREVQRSRMSSMFGASSEEPPRGLLELAGWFGYIEAAVGVAFAAALALIGLRYRARERLLGAGGGLLLFMLAVVGAGLAIVQRDALLSPMAFTGPSDYLRMTESLDPYMRVASTLAICAIALGLMRVADPTGIRSAHQVRGIRFITIVVVVNLGMIFGREALSTLGKGLWVLGLVALVVGIMALLDLNMLLRTAAQALRGELEGEDDEFDDLDDLERFNRYGRGRFGDDP